MKSLQLLICVLGWLLHFVLGPSLADKTVRLFVNHPMNAKSGPTKDTYTEIAWENLSSSKSDVFDNFASVTMVLCGSFRYFFTVDGR